MRMIDPLLGIKEMMRITGLSRVSVYRKVSAARAGQGRFPIPVSESKERLRWCADDVEAYCQARGVPQPPVKIPSPLKETKLTRERREHTEAILAGHGINLNKGGTNSP